MWNGIGIGIGRQQFLGSFSGSYSSRVLADGGTIESLTCVANASTLLQQASLLFIPSGYKAGVAYSALPNNGNGDLTWTRNSTAYRTNSNGKLEEIAYNLLLRTEEFENSAWVKVASSVVSNTTIAPNGTLTADSYTSNGILTIHRIYSSFSSIANLSYTISVYAKKETNDFFQIWIQAGGAFPANICFANYNLANGTLGTVGSGATANIESVGNGWYRCSFTCLATSTASSNLNFTITTSDTAPIAESNSLSTSIYIWGAQVVLGSNVKTYLPISSTRNNFPRLSYMYGSCPSALLEPQRTNLCLQSNNYGSTNWVKVSLSSTANSLLAPNDILEGTLISIGIDASPQRHRIYPSAAISFTSGVSYTYSVYAKKGSQNWIQLLYGTTAFDVNSWANFDINNGVVGTVGSAATAEIVSVGNGWYRCSITAIATITATATNEILAINNINSVRYPSFQSTTTEDIFYLWGGQLEAGAYPTTLINTTTASATRIADSFTRSNIYTNGLIGVSGGTWYVELKNNVSYVRDSNAVGLFLADTSDGSTNALAIRNPVTTSSRLVIAKRVSGTLSTLFTTATDSVKIAIKWNGSTADVFVNGNKVVSSEAFSTTVMNFLANSSVGDVPKFIQVMALYNTPLSDTDCITLTT